MQPTTSVIQSQESPALHGRVLLVEDNPVNSEVFLGMLAQLGCDALLAENGSLAVRQVKANAFDAVLMDYHLPDIDGIEATRQIRALQTDSRNVPIIALTANASDEDRARCLDAGMNGFLAKPCTLAQIAAALSEWLPSSAETTLTQPSDEAPIGDVDSRSVGAEDRHRFDEKALDHIRRLQGPDGTDMLAHVVQVFQRNAQESLHAIHDSISRRDADDLRFLAHKLKSGCANLGAVSMAGMSRDLEELARSGSTDGAEAIVKRLNSELGFATTWLEEQTSNANP